MDKLCTCGKKMTYHNKDSDDPLVMDIDEVDKSFWYCACGKIIKGG